MNKIFLNELIRNIQQIAANNRFKQSLSNPQSNLMQFINFMIVFLMKFKELEKYHDLEILTFELRRQFQGP